MKEKVEAHEKENCYKLHTFTPAVLYLACKSLFAKEESEMVFDSYADVVAFMQTYEYRVDTAEYSEDAVFLMHKLVPTMMLEKDLSLDMTMLTEEQRVAFNYTLLNDGFDHGFLPVTTDVVTGAPVGELYDTEVLNSYLSAFYEGGKVGELGNNLL